MPYYSPKATMTFLHVPKTGGSWVRHNIEKHDPDMRWAGLKHGGFNRDKTYSIAKKSTYVWTVLRDPLEWFISNWAFEMEAGWKYWEPQNEWHPNRESNRRCGADDINQYVRNVYDFKEKFISKMYANYFPEMNGYAPGLLDHIFIYDDLEEKTEKVMKEQFQDYNGIDKERINASDSDLKERAVEDMWPETKELVKSEESGLINLLDDLRHEEYHKEWGRPGYGEYVSFEGGQ